MKTSWHDCSGGEETFQVMLRALKYIRHLKLPTQLSIVSLTLFLVNDSLDKIPAYSDHGVSTAGGGLD